MTALKVMIFESHPFIRSKLQRFLHGSPEIEILGEVREDIQVTERTSKCVPDVIVLDLQSLGQDRMDFLVERQMKAPKVNTLVLMTDAEQPLIHKTLKAGALGYLLLDVDPGILVEAMKAVARGDAYVQAPLLPKVLEECCRLSSDETEIALSAQFRLTQRELEIIHSIANGRTNREIAESLFISEKTVKNHVSSILRKTHLDDRVQVAIFAYKKGLF